MDKEEDELYNPYNLKSNNQKFLKIVIFAAPKENSPYTRPRGANLIFSEEKSDLELQREFYGIRSPEGQI